MHPIVSDRKTFFLYLGTWLFIGLLIEVPYLLSHKELTAVFLLADIPLNLFCAVVCLSSYYLCRIFSIQTTQWYKLISIFIVAACIVSALDLAVGYGWTHFIDSLKIAPSIVPFYEPWIIGIFSTLVLIFLLVAAVHYVMIAFEQTREVERQSYELKLFAQDAELRALRAQINPHFLFNSLNSISALTGSNPEQARKMTLMLADFFRLGLKLGAEDYILLKDELSLVSNFLEIEKIRFGSRLHVIQDIEPEALGALVPPLILQPLVENAVRHGVAQIIDGGTVRITAAQTGSRIKLLVENPVDPDRTRRKGVGLGLRNVRARLDTLYNSDARVDVEETNEYFRVELIFPAQSQAN